MDQKRPKGRGIEEIAHFFFSSRTSPDESITPRDPPKGNVPSAKIFALVSLVEALPTPLFTSNLAIEMAARQKKVLVADTPPKSDWHAMNIFFAMGMGRPFTPIEQFLTGKTREVVASGPLGIRILSFPLDPGRVALLRSIHPGGLFRTLIHEERINDIFLVNMYPPSQTFRRSPADPGRDFDQDPILPDQNSLRIFSEALEILLLVPSDLETVKSSYYFVKSVLRECPQSSIGILLCHTEAVEGMDAIFGLLTEAATKFLGRKLKGYGHLVLDRQIYLSLIQGRPLCRMPIKDQNTSVFAEIAKKISEQTLDQIPLFNLMRPSPPEADRQLLLEALSTPSLAILPTRSHSSLSIEEDTFLNRLQVS